MMFLDVSKKPGDPGAVKTADEIVAENIHLRDLVQRLAQRLQMARLEGFGGPEREKLLDEAREAIGEAAHLRNSNAAALREALEELLSELEAVGFRPLVEGDPLAEAVLKARDALDAPARNCDSFATADEARRAFEEAHSRAIINIYMAAFDWLFATAEGVAE